MCECAFTGKLLRQDSKTTLDTVKCDKKSINIWYLFCFLVNYQQLFSNAGDRNLSLLNKAKNKFSSNLDDFICSI